MTRKQADRLRKLHARSVKAAQQFTAATPGTAKARKLWITFERAEHAFFSALNELDPTT